MYRKTDWSARILNVRHQLTLSAVLLLSAMLIVAIILAGGLRSLAEALRWNERAHEAVGCLSALDKRVDELATALRPEAASGQSSKLKSHLAGMEGEIARLHGLIGDEAAQAARLEQIKRVVDNWRKSFGVGGATASLEEIRVTIEAIEQAHSQLIAKRLAEAERLSTQITINVAILCLLIIAVTVVGSQRLARRIVDPINQMMLAAERLALGDLAPRVEEATRDEIGQLARVFNRMAERISEREAAILARNRELDELHEFNSLLQTSISEEEIHRALLQKVRAFDLQQAVILDRQAEENSLAVVAALHPPDLGPGDDHSAPPLPLCRVVRAGREMAVQDVADDLLCADCRFGQRRGSFFCVPITAGGQTIGALHLASPQAGYWTSERQRLVKALVDQAAPTINNLRLMEMMRNRALVDEQTQVYNRRFLDGYLRKQIGIARRGEAPLSVLMLDIDHFKRFNDRYGHEAGDTVLRQFAAAIASSLREGELVARYGGEEFTVVMNGTAKAAMTLAERLRRAVASLSFAQFALQGEDVRITMSIGIAEFPAHGQTPEDVLKAADVALYRAKHSGRNCVKLATRVLLAIKASR